MDQYEQTRNEYRFCEQWCSRSEKFVNQEQTIWIVLSDGFLLKELYFLQLLKTISFVTK